MKVAGLEMPITYNRTWLTLVVALAAACSTMGADDLNPATIKQAPTHAPVPLATDGQAQITLCLMDLPKGRPESLAVAELKACFQEIFGVELPVLEGRLPDANQPALVVGHCAEAEAAGIRTADLPIEGFVIKSAPNRIFIAGNDDAALRSHGTAWGIYDFLERVLDVRWYWPTPEGGRTLTRRAGQEVAPLWIEDAPVYRKREIWPSNAPGLPELHTALRAGNSWPVNLVVHAPHRWGTIFREERPEIFQLNRAGQRDSIMLCYGNPKTLETYLEVIDTHMKGEPQSPEAAQIINGNAITVSPWDVSVSCTCEDCRRLWDDEGGGYGSASPVLEAFVRKLAEAVKARWPELVVIYLPYLNYTLAASDQPFPDNLEVQLCGMPGVALYKEPAVWAKFQGNIDRWAALTARPVQTWDYSCWPLSSTRAPYHYPHVLKRYYTHNQGTIVGSFINGEKNHWPRSNFSLYCWMKLLWNPAFDVEAAADEACRRLFGPAAEPMRELWQLQASRWEDSRFPGGTLSAESIYTEAFPGSVKDRMAELLAHARRLAADDELVSRRLDYYAAPFAEFHQEFEFVVEGKGMTPLLLKKTGEMPSIDGRLDEAVWQTAEPVMLKAHDAKQKAARPATFPTEVRALWQPGQGIYVGFRMSEPNPQALRGEMHGKDDAGLWHQDCVEIFIDASGRNSGSFYQWILTAGGAVFTAKDGDTGWDCDGLQFAHQLGDDFWTMEIFIPAASMGVDFSSTVGGREWYGQLTRHRMGDGAGGHENQKLNANQGGFNSNTGDFALFRFVE